MNQLIVNVCLYLSLGFFLSSCGDCAECVTNLAKTLVQNGVSICYESSDPSTQCGGDRVYACNSSAVSKSAKIAISLAFGQATPDEKNVSIPAYAQIDNKLAPFLGMSEGFTSTGQCTTRNFRLLSAS